MKTLCLVLIVVIAVLLYGSSKTVIHIQPGNSYLVYEFPRGAETPWFRYDSREKGM